MVNEIVLGDLKKKLNRKAYENLLAHVMMLHAITSPQLEWDLSAALV